ncbi:MAG TPA: ABC transporter substrate-binding protein [Nitrospira sp.]|nr:ABC transporter substrate-binding protein [Nitrospira sp.]
MRPALRLGTSGPLLFGPTPLTHHLLAVLTGVIVVMVWVGAAPVGQTRTPTESVHDTINKLALVLNNQELKLPGRTEERRWEIEQVIRDRVNYKEMAGHALGLPWEALSDKGRQQFADLFVQLLRVRFGDSITELSDAQVEYLDERRVGSLAEVRTKLIGHKVDIPLDFRLMRQSSDWVVYDVLADGVSIVNNYHAQIAKIIRDFSYEGLLEKMREKVSVLKLFEKMATP